MPGKSKAQGADREGGRALDYVKTQQEVGAKAAGRAAEEKAAKAARPTAAGDSPKRQGDKLEKARDAAAGKARRG